MRTPCLFLCALLLVCVAAVTHKGASTVTVKIQATSIAPPKAISATTTKGAKAASALILKDPYKVGPNTPNTWRTNLTWELIDDTGKELPWDGAEIVFSIEARSLTSAEWKQIALVTNEFRKALDLQARIYRVGIVR